MRDAPTSLTLLRVLRLVTSAAPAITGRLTVVTLVTGLLPPAEAWLSKQIVDGITGIGGAALPGGTQGLKAPLALVVALYVLAYGVAAALRPVERTLTRRLDDAAIAAVDRALMRAAARAVDLERIGRPGFYDELGRIERSNRRLTALPQGITYSASALIAIFGLLALLTQLHPLLPFILALLSIPHLFVVRRMHNEVYEYMDSHSRMADEMGYCLRVTTEPAAAKEVRVFGTGDYFYARHRERYQRAQCEVDRVRVRHLSRAAALVLLDAGALAGGLWYVGTQAAAGMLTPGDVALYFSAVVQAPGLLGRLPSGFSALHGAQLHGKGFFAFLDDARPHIRLPEPERALTCPRRLQSGFELRELSFAYNGDPVLDRVSFALPAGKVTALVGHNGAGKSTLVKLLARLHDPTGGEIHLDGRPLHDYDLDGLRSHVGVVYQDFARFSLSLRDNIAVGAGTPAVFSVTDGDVERAAAWSGANEVAAALPRGYDTQVTRQFEGGVDLSGGEWQKVALARGVMRDAALVILDEPTSALDADAEHRLFQRFRELMQGRTALLISHRFSTVRMADHIVVLEHGRVVEQGTHDTLIARGGRYASLYELQAARYR